MSEETRPINVQCPVCNAKQDFDVPTQVIKANVKGVSTIAIMAKCGHSFHIFVDKNFSIRGYQRSDFDITSTAVESVPVENLSLPGIVRMFGEDNFSYAMRAMLLNKKTILVGSDQQILKSLFINFIALFERELADSTDAIMIMSSEEFTSLRPQEYWDTLVVDLDFSVIKSNPFKDDKAKIERDLLKETMSFKNLEQQKQEFKARVSRIFLYANIILNFIYQGQNNFKEIKKRMKDKDKNIPQNELDLAWMVANARYANLLA